MWSLNGDHTHCFLKLGIIKPAKVARLVTYNRDCAGRARAVYPKYGIRCYYRTYGHTHTSVTSRTTVIRSIVAYSISCGRYLLNMVLLY